MPYTSVDGYDDEQINNRLLQAEIDASSTQDTRVAKFQRESETTTMKTQI